MELTPGQEAWQARMRLAPQTWRKMLEDWAYQARMNRDHGYISEKSYQQTVEHLKSEWKALSAKFPSPQSIPRDSSQ
jgi:hypothetical protein